MSPKLTEAAESEFEATTLEKIWQPLFENGRPTIRLSQFLRGLAMHIIDEFEPKGSLVVTPSKMMQFFNDNKVAGEHYPWTTIFGGKIANTSISSMYRKLLCQHHLVQNNYHESPSVPGLTPIGFEKFMTCMIQAHPDTEFQRLAQAVQHMPISNADNKTERFPKQLSRRLLPAESNRQAEQRLISSLIHEPELVPPEREQLAMPRPPPEPPLQNYIPERERNPYSHSQQTNAIYDDDEDVSPPAVPIERERKPYFAKEGTGKKYDNEHDRGMEYDRGQHRPTPVTRTSRTGPGYPTATDPMNIPFSHRRHRMSTGPPPASWSNSGRRSPPQSGYARSDPVDVGGISPSQYTSNLHGPPMREPSMRDPHTMRDPSMRDPSMYDPTSFAHRNSVNSLDGRRRSWFSPGGGPGTDGYGSYSGSPH